MTWPNFFAEPLTCGILQILHWSYNPCHNIEKQNNLMSLNQPKPIIELRFYCPCCGYQGLGQNPYDQLHAPPFGDLGEPSYIERFGLASLEGCHSCGYQFGYDDDPAASGSAVSFSFYRQRWIECGCRWFCGADPRPENWSVLDQLAAAGILVKNLDVREFRSAYGTSAEFEQHSVLSDRSSPKVDCQIPSKG
jgi:hypothetical protein